MWHSDTLYMFTQTGTLSRMTLSDADQPSITAVEFRVVGMSRQVCLCACDCVCVRNTGRSRQKPSVSSLHTLQHMTGLVSHNGHQTSKIRISTQLFLFCLKCEERLRKKITTDQLGGLHLHRDLEINTRYDDTAPYL